MNTPKVFESEDKKKKKSEILASCKIEITVLRLFCIGSVVEKVKETSISPLYDKDSRVLKIKEF